MKRILCVLALLALTSCKSMSLSAPGPLSMGKDAQSPAGWARLIDVQHALGGSSPALDLQAYLNCAAAAEKNGDQGAAVLCLEAAYRLSFKLTGLQRWDQEAQRVKLARRLQSLKAGQGRKGAAAAYGALAALSEAYEDGGQSEDDKKAYADAQARIAAAKAQKEAADNQALMGLFSGTLNNAMGMSMGTLDHGTAMLNQLQVEMDYLQTDSKNAEAAKGIGDAEAALRQGSAREVQDRASRLLAAFLAGTTDCAPYAKAVQAEVRRSGLDTSKGAMAEFLALAPPDRSRSSKREFVRGFQAVEKELWTADLKQAPLDLAPLKPQPLGGDWDRTVDNQKVDFYLAFGHEGSYARSLSWSETSSGKKLTKPLTATAAVNSANGVVFGWVGHPYQGAGLYWDARGVFEFADISFPVYRTATASCFDFSEQIGLGAWIPLGSRSGSALTLGAATRFLEFGDTTLDLGKTSYDSFEFRTLGLDLEASLILWGVIKLGVAQPLVAPINGDDSRDPGGTKFRLGFVFAFEATPSAKDLAQAEVVDLPAMPLSGGGGSVTRVDTGGKNGRGAKAIKAKGKRKSDAEPAPEPTAVPTAEPTPEPTPTPRPSKAKARAKDEEKAQLKQETEDLAAEKEALRQERLKLEEEKAKLKKAKEEAGEDR